MRGRRCCTTSTSRSPCATSSSRPTESQLALRPALTSRAAPRSLAADADRPLRSHRFIAATHGSQIQVWQTPSNLAREFAPFILHRTYTGHYDDVLSIQWSADSRFFLTTSKDMTAKLYTLYPVEGYKPKTFSGHRDAVLAAYFSTDHKTVSSKPVCHRARRSLPTEADNLSRSRRRSTLSHATEPSSPGLPSLTRRMTRATTRTNPGGSRPTRTRRAPRTRPSRTTRSPTRAGVSSSATTSSRRGRKSRR